MTFLTASTVTIPSMVATDMIISVAGTVLTQSMAEMVVTP
jgi:hypothetical protein